MQPEAIDVSGLPDEVVEDIQKLVRSIRNNLPEKGSETKPSPSAAVLPRWEGTVLGPLSRRDLYDDVG